MKIAGIIPSRYDSSRFPGKPLADIMGKTMIRRVYDQACKADTLEKVVVATDDQRIFDEITNNGGNAMMTASYHQSGTDRCSEVIEKLNSQGETFDAVINIQGDEPFIDPGQINQVANIMQDATIQIATLIKEIQSAEEIFYPNVVKVVVDNRMKAIYFSRSAIPWVRNTNKTDWIQKRKFYKHIGIYAYRTEVLMKIVKLMSGSLESAESLEQLRWIENGYSVQTIVTDFESIAVDTPQDLSKIFNRH
nr:3-deoxy-manno-octulosonate cytidylyltransferase [Bacteroidota bacterium]